MLIEIPETICSTFHIRLFNLFVLHTTMHLQSLKSNDKHGKVGL